MNDNNGSVVISDETTTGLIPVIDFGDFNISTTSDNINDDVKRRLAAQIHTAFTNIGFVYLKNHGVATEKVGN